MNIPTRKCMVEVLQRKCSKLTKDEVATLVFDKYFARLCGDYPVCRLICEEINDLGPDIINNIEEISICNAFTAPIDQTALNILAYKANETGPMRETLKCGDSDEESPASSHWILPARDFHGMWDNLFYADNLKENLLRFAETTLLFSGRKVDPNVISCNRLMLLHGPPGTGKTSLCKAIAQKLAIRCANQYKFTHLIEINSHSLFSKWFSESGKLVMTLFDDIRNILDHKQSLVCLLIDEVESIAFARSSVSDNEPSDSLRVVNAVLTQLDQIRHYSNLIVLTTSNLTGTIDLAFIDRADIKQYIGHPSPEAIYHIYGTAVDALIKANIIAKGTEEEEDRLHKEDLKSIAEMSKGLSGRSLRKIPFLAHALHLSASNDGPVGIGAFLVALREAVIKHKCDEAAMVQTC